MREQPAFREAGKRSESLEPADRSRSLEMRAVREQARRTVARIADGRDEGKDGAFFGVPIPASRIIVDININSLSRRAYSAMKDQLARDTAALGDDDHIRSILAEVCALTGMGFSAIAFVSEDRWIACQIDDRIDFGLDPGAELEVRKTICDEIRRNGKTVIIDDTNTDHDWWNHPVPILYGFHSYISLPIILDDGSFFGTLCAIDPDPRLDRLADLREQLEGLARKVASLISAKIKERPLQVCDQPLSAD